MTHGAHGHGGINKEATNSRRWDAEDGRRGSCIFWALLQGQGLWQAGRPSPHWLNVLRAGEDATHSFLLSRDVGHGGGGLGALEASRAQDREAGQEIVL